MTDRPKQAKPKVNAQDYEQRSYEDVVKQLEEQQTRHILERLGAG